MPAPPESHQFPGASAAGRCRPGPGGSPPHFAQEMVCRAPWSVAGRWQATCIRVKQTHWKIAALTVENQKFTRGHTHLGFRNPVRDQLMTPNDAAICPQVTTFLLIGTRAEHVENAAVVEPCSVGRINSVLYLGHSASRHSEFIGLRQRKPTNSVGQPLTIRLVERIRPMPHRIKRCERFRRGQLRLANRATGSDCQGWQGADEVENPRHGGGKSRRIQK
jgi:hypothetical protein